MTGDVTGPAHSDAARHRYDPRADRVTVLYVAGEGRSGSTLLSRMLGAMPGVVCLGEVVHLWQRGVVDGERCGCGVPLPECSFWSSVSGRAFGGWDTRAQQMLDLRTEVDRQRFIPLMVVPALAPSFGRKLRRYTEGLADLYRAAAEVGGSTVVVDSSKHPSTAFALRHAPGVDLRVIHLIRDSRGVATSWTRRVEKPEVLGRTAFMPQYHPARAALRWLGTNLEIHALEAVGVDVHRVRYEALVASPQEELLPLAAAAGLPDEPSPLDFLDGSTVHLGVDHTAAGNPMRFRRGELMLLPDEAWRRELRGRHRSLVTALTWPLLRRYGYSEATTTGASPSQPAAAAWSAQALSPQSFLRPGFAASRTYAFVPSRRRPRQLLPLSSRHVAAGAVAAASVGGSPIGRLARRVGAIALRVGVIQPLLRHRLHVAVGVLTDPALVEHLREVTGAPVADVGVRFGPPRPNAKPVLQLLAADGRVLAYAKVGWNDLTNRLVAAEARSLAWLAETSWAVLSPPRLLHAGEWRGAQIVVQSPLDLRSRGRTRRGRLHTAALHEMATVVHHRREILADSTYAAAMTAAISSLSSDERAARLRAAWEAVLHAHGERQLRLGPSHGDFSPWNTAATGDRLHAWDWERARVQVPVGFDALHFHLVRTMAADRRGLRAALPPAADAARAWADSTWSNRIDDRLVALYLCDRTLRHLGDGWQHATPSVRQWCADALRHVTNLTRSVR